MLPEGGSAVAAMLSSPQAYSWHPSNSITAPQPPDSPLVPVFPSIHNPGCSVQITQSSRDERDLAVLLPLCVIFSGMGLEGSGLGC